MSEGEILCPVLILEILKKNKLRLDKKRVFWLLEEGRLGGKP
jgi:hypothetical protein